MNKLELSTPNGYKFTVDENLNIVMEMTMGGFTILLKSTENGQVRYENVQYSQRLYTKDTLNLHDIILTKEQAEYIDATLKHEIMIARTFIGTLSIKRDADFEYKNYKD